MHTTYHSETTDNETMIRIAIQFILLVLIQSLIFNNLIIGGYAMACVFVYSIIALPVTLNDNLRLTIGFLLGLMVDIFANTQGLNALCCTMAVALQRPVFHLYVNREEDLAGATPSSRSMGHAAFLKYAVTMTLIYCALMHTVESFSFFNFGRLMLRISTGTVYTFVIVFAIDSILSHRRGAKS